MNNLLSTLKQLYQTPFVQGLVAAAEGGAVGVLTDASLDYGELFQPHGLKHLATAVVIGAGIAVRNYLKNRPGQPAVPNGNAKQNG
jgi:hypothetical protein